MKLIASGAYGSVYDLGNGVAFKTSTDRAEINQEWKTIVSIYEKLGSKCKSYIPKPISIGIIGSYSIGYIRYGYSMELIKGITLRKFMSKRTSLEKKEKVLKEVRKAFRCLWRAGFVHGDAHMNNILVTPDEHIKIIDFGFTLETTPLSNNDNFKGWFKKQYEKLLAAHGIEKANPNLMYFSCNKKKSTKKRLEAYCSKNDKLIKKVKKDIKVVKLAKYGSMISASKKKVKKTKSPKE